MALRYDPRSEYLTPPLQGFRLQGSEYRPLPAVTMLPDRKFAIHSDVLGLDLRDEREVEMLRLHDPATGLDLLTYAEVDKAREAEAAARQQEAAVRRTAEARIAELEARLRDLDNASARPDEP